jgi:hypothetical protein
LPTDHIPTISQAAAGWLRPFAVDLQGDDAPSYGSPLLEIVALTAPWPAWLEAAVLAGYVPPLQGIEIAVHGIQAFTRERIADSEREGATREAIAWTVNSRVYRDLVALLEGYALELDCEAERIRRASDSPPG